MIKPVALSEFEFAQQPIKMFRMFSQGFSLTVNLFSGNFMIPENFPSLEKKKNKESFTKKAIVRAFGFNRRKSKCDFSTINTEETEKVCTSEYFLHVVKNTGEAK